MEYKVIKNNSTDFWEDNKDDSFGIGKDLVIKLDKNKILVESHGIDVFLVRDNKKAKISDNEKVIKGVVEVNDELYLGKDVTIKFSAPAKQGIKDRVPRINWNLWVGVTVLLLILVTIFFGWKKNTEINTEKQYQTVLLDVKDKISKSDEIKSMDPDTGLKLLNEANGKILQIKNNKIHGAEVIELEKNINEKLTVSGSTEVVGFTEIYNAKSADVTDRNYDKMVVSGNEAVLAEGKTGKIILINLDLGSVTKFDVGQEIIDLIYTNKKIYFYDGRSIIDSSKNKVAELGDIVYLKIMNWNSGWYLLGQEGKISKFVDNKVSAWTSGSVKLIDKPVSMTIDGTVWVVDGDGNVMNYEKGLEKKWSPSLKIVGEKVLGITTTADSTKISIISDKKVFVFEKTTGKLLATHNFEKIGIIEAKMGNNEQIYVLGSDLKIYKVK